MKTRFSVILLISLLATDSVWAEDKTVGNAPYSGFLKNYVSRLLGSADHEGLWLYIDKSRDYRGYTKLMFDPVLIYNNQYPKPYSVQPRLLYEMRGDILASLTSALTPGYEIVQEPGPDVLRFRISIYGVEMVPAKKDLLDYVPVKAAIDLVTGGEVVPQMIAEMEVVDVDGKGVAAIAAQHMGETKMSRDDIKSLKWADLQPITDYWAKGLRQGLDQLRNVPVASNAAH